MRLFDCLVGIFGAGIIALVLGMSTTAIVFGGLTATLWARHTIKIRTNW
jgi:hypothetical protein